LIRLAAGFDFSRYSQYDFRIVDFQEKRVPPRWRFHGAVRGGFLTLLAILAGSALRAQQFDASKMEGLKWRLVGPFRGGRSLIGVGIPGNPDVYYFGAVSGGVWKTINGGLTWSPTFDNEPVSSIGAIAVADSDPNIIYVGTGEACPRGNISYGDGVYKSVDAGKTWTNVGLKDTRHIGSVIVDPRDPNIVLVAALGHVYGPNPERGVFRSTDGGKTWQKVLYKDENTGAEEVIFDPHDAHIVYAALWQVSRTPWSLTSGGPGSGLYKSIDGGTTWKHLEGHGLPAGVLGKISVAPSGADSSRVYALIEAEKGGLYKSNDGGESWEFVNGDHRFRQRAWYFTHAFADPKNIDTVYVLNTGFYRSTNGGKDFTRIPGSHGDHHGLWIDPTNPNRMINANDGGVTITTDGGKTWNSEDNQPTAQFYHVSVDNRFPYYLYGAQQDNSSVAIASGTVHEGIGRADWYPAGGGESGYIVPDPVDANIVYGGSYFGELTRFDKMTGQAQVISPWPDDPDGRGAEAAKYRYTWTAPFGISPHDHNTIYFASQVLFKSTNGGMSWTQISPDLTRNDKSKQQSSGGPITKDNSSAEFYDLIFTFAESPVQKGLIWAGTDDGLIQLTRDGGEHWNNVTPKGLPAWGLVSLIEPSPFDAGTAYAAVDCRKLDDFRPYIFKTHDFGKTWTKITAGIPVGSYVHAVRQDTDRKGLLFAGTETGVFLSFDDGDSWQSLRLNLPTVPVHDLAIKNGDLVIATHGRAFWILDDISPLRQFSPASLTAPAVFYKPRPAVRIREEGQIPGLWTSLVGQNPPAGAILYYSLADAPKENEEITLEILDKSGKRVREFSNRASEEAQTEASDEDDDSPEDQLPASAGLNRFVWDLRYEKPREVPGAIYDEGGPLGALALSGKYTAKLTAGGTTYSQVVEIIPDPRIGTSEQDLAKQFDLMTRLRDAFDADHAAVLEIRDLRKQLDSLHKHLADDRRAKDVTSTIEALQKRISDLEEGLIETKAAASEDMLNYPTELNSKLGYLENAVDSADTAPTQQDYELAEQLENEVNKQTSAWDEVQKKDVTALNEMIRKDGIEPIIAVTHQKASGSAAK
jgi:photosystem II stability/assembly factor-like uncharacterized protein